MSEPKRYKHTFLYGTDGFVNESFLIDEKHNMADEGDYVLYSDYARLKAEVEQLKHKLGRLLGAYQQWELVEPREYASLKAEVERLRSASFVTAVPVEQYERVIKAGNWMAALLGHDYKGDPVPSVQAWLTAKEGKPSV